MKTVRRSRSWSRNSRSQMRRTIDQRMPASSRWRRPADGKRAFYSPQAGGARGARARVPHAVVVRWCQPSNEGGKDTEGALKKEFDHIGIITTEPHEGESWVPHSKVWVTNPRLHPQRIEYIRPLEFPTIDPANVAQWKLWHLPHVAYRVDDLAAAIAGQEVILG